MAGDKVAMSVNTLYNGGYRADEDQPITSDLALGAITGTLTGGVGAIPGEGHNTKLVTDAFTNSNYTVFNDVISTTTDPSKPKAFLNYVLFDENMKIVNSMTGAFQANGDNNWSVIGTTTAMEVPSNGYLAVYLSNNSSSRVNCFVCTDVFFDDLRFTVTKGSLLEETHYYPFGLPMVAISSVTADGFIENRHKYQGNELIKDLQLNLMDFQARQYDPQIGRFLSPDPLAGSGGQDMFSPYAAMGNTPESNVDPSGLMPVDKTRFADQSRTWDFIQADGSPGGGAGSASGQGRDAWADGGFGRDSYGALSGFGNGMDAGVARWMNSLAIKSLVSFVNSILRVGGTQNYSLNTETGQGDFWGGIGEGTTTDYQFNGSLENGGFTNDGSGLFKYSISQKDASGVTGIDFKAVATLNISGYTDVDYIQSVFTNLPDRERKGARANKFYLDGSKNQTMAPFYFSANLTDRMSLKNLDQNNGGKYFEDHPGRPTNLGSQFWLGQLSLVGKKNGVYENILTIRYGYTYFYGAFKIINPVICQPEKFQQFLIKSANNSKP